MWSSSLYQNADGTPTRLAIQINEDQLHKTRYNLCQDPPKRYNYDNDYYHDEPNPPGPVCAFFGLVCASIMIVSFFSSMELIGISVPVVTFCWIRYFMCYCNEEFNRQYKYD